MKTRELVTKDAGKLKEQLLELKKELMKELSQQSTGATSKSPKKVRQLKKNIAQVMTFLNKNKQKVEVQPKHE
ncbi:50S ribosomal protein L29 [Candidatus Woesearchaeota archaeon]|nr:50S ribosomal protein L29 [Candidatus Woesearchaeota archaeon]